MTLSLFICINDHDTIVRVDDGGGASEGVARLMRKCDPSSDISGAMWGFVDALGCGMRWNVGGSD